MLYLSLPTGQEDESITLLPELDGKRNLKKEEVKQSLPEKTITLPDGRVIKVDGDRRRGGRKAKGEKSGEKPKAEGAKKKAN
jgi:hypothetical protein